ncbi:MAG: GntR family transcriptional regulator [Negativicutes bacterium]|nr:GntR family transcriptional regulator [Negativicutes bacterium]
MIKETTKMNKKQEAYGFIRSQILNGTYGPGYRIVIDRVARELGLSSIPVREAINQLGADGLIEVIPYTGAIVQQVNETDYQEAAFVMLVLEGAATALAANYLTTQEIKAIEKINRLMEKALDNLDFEQVGELNAKFHAAIHDRCGNSYLIERLNQVWQRISQVRQASFPFAPQRARESIREHDGLIELLKQKASSAQIEDCVRQHKLNTLQAVKNSGKNNNGYKRYSV